MSIEIVYGATIFLHRIDIFVYIFKSSTEGNDTMPYPFPRKTEEVIQEQLKVDNGRQSQTTNDMSLKI